MRKPPVACLRAEETSGPAPGEKNVLSSAVHFTRILSRNHVLKLTGKALIFLIWATSQRPIASKNNASSVIFCWTWISLALASLVSKIALEMSCLWLQNSLITGSHHAWSAFMWVLGIQTLVLMFVWQTLYQLRHFSGPPIIRSSNTIHLMFV